MVRLAPLWREALGGLLTRGADAAPLLLKRANLQPLGAAPPPRRAWRERPARRSDDDDDDAQTDVSAQVGKAAVALALVAAVVAVAYALWGIHEA